MKRLSLLFRTAAAAALVTSAAWAGSATFFQDTMNPGDVFTWDAPLPAGGVLMAMSTPLDNGDPDTILGAFDPNDNLLALNDDDGGASNGSFDLASAIRMLAPAQGTFSLRLTGYDDFGFSGLHSESGPFAMTFGTVPASAGGDFADSAGNNGPASADPLGISGGQAAIARNSFDTAGGDVDFYSVFLHAGETLNAMTAALEDPNFLDPDTILGVFDTDGTTQLVANDDAGTHDPDDGDLSDYSSVLRFVAPADGTYYLAVTGFSDFDFVGNHSQVGDYGLMVSIVPEPASLALLLVGAGAVVWRLRK